MLPPSPGSGLSTALEEVIRAFVQYYNYRRYHGSLVDVTPFDVYVGRRLEIVQRRKGVKSRTLEVKRSCDSNVKEQGFSL